MRPHENAGFQLNENTLIEVEQVQLNYVERHSEDTKLESKLATVETEPVITIHMSNLDSQRSEVKTPVQVVKKGPLVNSFMNDKSKKILERR